MKEKFVVGRAGFEPATFRLSVERSSRAELPAHICGGNRLMICWFKRIFVSSVSLRINLEKSSCSIYTRP